MVMINTIVYNSCTGSCKKYAQLMSEATGLPAYSLKEYKRLRSRRSIVYVGWLFGGMASSYYSRRFPDVPVFHLCFPVRYLDEETVQCGAEDIKACIKFVEEQTGAQWNWDAYFTAMTRFNKETDYELQKWEVNKTDYPQLIGPCYELYRKWNYEMDGGTDPRILKTCEKVNKLLMEMPEHSMCQPG